MHVYFLPGCTLKEWNNAVRTPIGLRGFKREITKDQGFWHGEGNGTPLQYSCLENPMDGGAWWAAVHGVAKSRTRLSDFTLTFNFHALEKEMATHSSVLAWRIPGMGEPGGLLSMRSQRVRHNWSDLAAAANTSCLSIMVPPKYKTPPPKLIRHFYHPGEMKAPNTLCSSFSKCSVHL